MRQVSIFVFTASPEYADTIRQAAVAANTPVDIAIGDIAHAASVARTWSAVPEILMLDVSGEPDQEGAIARFAEAAPRGETALVIIGRGDDIKTYRSFKQMGAVEYIAVPVERHEVDHAIATVRKALAERAKTPDASKLIMVASARGGAGGSMVAAELSRGIAARHHKNTILMDLDLESGCQHSIFNVEPTQSFGLMLDKPERVDAVLLNRTIAKTSDKNLTLLSDAMPDSGSRFVASAPAQVAGAIAKDVDAILFDIPARSPFFKDLCSISATLVIVTPATFLGLRDTVAMVNTAEKTGGPRRCIILVNKVGEVRSGSVGPEIFKQETAKGARPEFRSTISVHALPYSPKQVLRASNTSESLLNDASTPLAKSIVSVLGFLPTAPAAPKRTGLFAKIIG